MKVDICASDDYAIASIGRLSFYYGYEETVPTDINYESNEPYEWAFVAKEDGREDYRWSQSQIEKNTRGGDNRLYTPQDYLLAGIVLYMNYVFCDGVRP